MTCFKSASLGNWKQFNFLNKLNILSLSLSILSILLDYLYFFPEEIKRGTFQAILYSNNFKIWICSSLCLWLVPGLTRYRVYSQVLLLLPLLQSLPLICPILQPAPLNVSNVFLISASWVIFLWAIFLEKEMKGNWKIKIKISGFFLGMLLRGCGHLKSIFPSSPQCLRAEVMEDAITPGFINTARVTCFKKPRNINLKWKESGTKGKIKGETRFWQKE